MPSGLKLDTLLIHGGGRAPVQRGRPTSDPIVQSTAFAYDTAEALADVFAGTAPGHVYSRISNPTVLAFERRVAALEQGLGAQACASGMAAITAVVMALCAQDDEIVAAPDLFGGTRSLLDTTLGRFGVRARFVSMHDLDAVREAIGPRTRMVFVETISNPKLAVADIAALAAIANDKGVPLVVDSTVTTPILVQPVTLFASLSNQNSLKLPDRLVKVVVNN